MPSSSKPKLSVAIVGASFGGLAAAIRLKKELGNDGVEVVVFEAQSKGAFGAVCGELFLAHGETSFRSLGLSGTWMVAATKKSGAVTRIGVNIHEEDLQRALREVASEWIQYSSHVLGVIRGEGDDGQMYCVVCTKPISFTSFRKSGEFSLDGTVGPFDIVIAADGVHSRFRSLLNSTMKVALVGDARWCKDWFDFGLSRIRCGADMAICDAIEVGNIIAAAARAGNMSQVELGRFCAHKKSQDISRRKSFLLKTMVFVLGMQILLWRQYQLMNLVFRSSSFVVSSLALSVLLYVGGLVRVSFPQSISPVPVTLHTLVACWGGMVFGPSAAATGTLIYALFWTVLSLRDEQSKATRVKTRVGILNALLQKMPSLGYIAGLVPCATVAGCVPLHPILAAVIGQVCTLTAGISWLTLSRHSSSTGSLYTLVRIGVFPFLPGLALKSIGAWILLVLYQQATQNLFTNSDASR